MVDDDEESHLVREGRLWRFMIAIVMKMIEMRKDILLISSVGERYTQI